MSDPVATGILPWDLAPADGGPRRASLADMGGATVEDEDPKPDKATMIYADLMNGLQQMSAAHDKAVIAIGISVTFSGGTPTVSQVTGPSGAAVVASITVIDNGTGDTTLVWPVDTFPPSVLGPVASLNGLTLGNGIGCALGTFGGLPGVRVKTWDGSNAATDVNFTVTVY